MRGTHRTIGYEGIRSEVEGKGGLELVLAKSFAMRLLKGTSELVFLDEDR